MSRENQIIEIISGKNGHTWPLPTLLRGMADRLGNFAPSDDLRYAAHKMANEVSKLLQDEKVNTPEYRPWANLAEMVEDGAHEWWFRQECSRGFVTKPSNLDFDNESLCVCGLRVFVKTMNATECSPSPLGPWQPCGRKVDR